MFRNRLLLITVLAILSSSTTEATKPPFLLFANRGDIRIVNLETTKANSTVIVGHLEEAAAIDFYYAEDIIFWADIGLETIKGLRINGSQRNDFTIINTGITSPDGLSCDWLTKKLYWTDSETKRIEVNQFNGSNRKVLFYKDLDQPRAIAVDPLEGWMFWSDWGEVPKIEKASMDGDPASRMIIVKQNIFWPNGLTIDYETKRVYWTDAKLKFIASMDYDGQSLRKIVEGNLPHPFALTVLGDWLYWTDWNTNSIHSCNKNTGGKRKSIISGGLRPMGIHAYSSSRQPLKSTMCDKNNGGCSHLCLLSSKYPHYSCACPTGVRLLDDKKNCANGAQKSLILARRVDIRKISLDTNDHTDVVLPLKGIKHAIAVDYDPVENRIYWSDDDARAIRRAFLNGSNQEDVVIREVRNPDGVAVDWIARNLYWTDTGTDRIEVSFLNGTSRKILITDNLEEPRAIVVHPIQGRMYWTDWGPRPKIERAALDGSEREVIVNTSLGWPNGIAIDYSAEKIYWADAKLDKIEMSEFSGRDRQELLSEQMPHIFGFTLMDDYVYWTDWQRRSIERAHKITGGDREVIVDQLPDLMGLKAISVTADLGTNSCASGRKTCSHLCFSKPGNNYVCACPMGYELKSDLKTCVVPGAFLLFSRKTDIRRISLESGHLDLIPVSGIQEASAFDYDLKYKRIYWTDAKLKTISRAFINGSNFEHIIDVGLENPEGMAVDWIAENLYWTDLSNRQIEVSRLDGSSRRVLIWKDVEKPKSLALDSNDGFMYWTDWGTTPRIERAALDASKRFVIVSRVNRPNGLTIDFVDKRLFWVDIGAKTIESSDLNGSNRAFVVSEDLPKPYGLTVYQDFVYWSDWESNKIERANKKTGASRTLVKDNLQFVTDIVVFHTSRQSGWNPCAVNNGDCEHLCLTLPLSATKGYRHRCACPTHYTLKSDNRTCSAPNRFILYSQRNSITRLVVDNDNTPNVVLSISGLKNVKALSYDPLEHNVYWIDSRTSTVRKAQENGSKSAVVVPNPHNLFAPYDFVLDPYSRVLYWSCSQTNSINITRLDGQSVGSLFGDEQGHKEDRPRALALHLKKGLLFWVNAQTTPKIMKSTKDGLENIVLVDQQLKEPTSLTIDTVNDNVYWSDTLLKRIELCDIYGKNRRVLVASLIHPTALAVFKDHLYWIDKDQKVLSRTEKLTPGASYQVVNSRISHLTDLIAVEPFDRSSSSSCQVANGGCSHLCIVHSTGYKCSCPNGLVLSNDEKTCTSTPTCSPDQFVCSNGKCIPQVWRCDGSAECDDKSDEQDCAACISPQYKCPRSNLCLEPSSICDGVNDCPDSSDEHCCNSEEFRCLTYQKNCVPFANLCDGNADCDDGSDETTDSCHRKLEVTSTIEVTKNSYGTWYTICAVFLVLIVVSAVMLVLYKKKRDGEEECEIGVNDMLMERCASRSDRMSNGALGSRKTFGLGSCPAPTGSQLSEQMYERGRLTGASSSSSSTGRNYPKETLNPPPSPVTQSCCSSGTQSRHSRGPLFGGNHRRSRRSLRRPGPHPTPCTTDVNEESDYPYASAYYSNSQVDVSYDSDPYPPPPTPSHYFSDASPPPSPFTERSFNPQPPPPSPII